MKIAIDTKHDSKEDIKKAIQLLQHMVNEPATSEVLSEQESSNTYTDMFAEKPQEKSQPYTNMFAENPSTPEPPKQEQTVFNIFDSTQQEESSEPEQDEESQEEESEVEIEKPEIIPY